MEEANNWWPEVLDTFLLLGGDTDLGLLGTEPLLDAGPEETVVNEEANGEQLKATGPQSQKETKFNCPMCGKSFAYQSRLERHLTTHQVNGFYPLL